MHACAYYLYTTKVHSPCEAPDNYLAVNTDIQNKPRQALAGMMSALDDQLTDVIGGFKNKGIWDNTIFIFTTDNGGTGCGLLSLLFSKEISFFLFPFFPFLYFPFPFLFLFCVDDGLAA